MAKENRKGLGGLRNSRKEKERIQNCHFFDGVIVRAPQLPSKSVPLDFARLSSDKGQLSSLRAASSDKRYSTIYEVSSIPNRSLATQEGFSGQRGALEVQKPLSL